MLEERVEADSHLSTSRVPVKTILQSECKDGGHTDTFCSCHNGICVVSLEAGNKGSTQWKSECECEVERRGQRCVLQW